MLLYLNLGHRSLQASKQHFFFFFAMAYLWQKKFDKFFSSVDPSFHAFIPMAKSTYKKFTFQVNLPL